MPGTYAPATNVNVESSRREIERTLSRFGARKFGYMSDDDLGLVAVTFEITQVRVMMRMQLPERNEFQTSPTGKWRTEVAIDNAWEQAVRQRWRTLANGIKAKLAMVDDGIRTIEQEFLNDLVLPGGGTIGDRVIPELHASLRTGELPPLLPGLPEPPRVIAIGEGKRA